MSVIQTASQRLAELLNQKAKAAEAAQVAQTALENAEKELLGEARKEQEELIKTLPGLLGVESLSVVSALVSLMAKDGSLANAKSGTGIERKERVTLTLVQKLALLVDKAGGMTNAVAAAKYNISPGTVFNLANSSTDILKEAKETKVQIPAALLTPAKPGTAKPAATAGKQ